jgi:hypothetical protein
MRKAIEITASVQVEMREFSTWEPEQITAFINGVGLVVAAYSLAGLLDCPLTNPSKLAMQAAFARE